ncbi:pentatricopeptide repeat-containing protein At5g48910-like [Mangifera indica]|uniref:pentatricopeptide repeat-containing protein At5g48910-like n=1 Tax=Mangifera indica TaxID=29780 RepID=UPI001CFA34D2|nr:pentatricopeptide repeat-containing protein At5g48910-like [Mangifera indica]
MIAAAIPVPASILPSLNRCKTMKEAQQIHSYLIKTNLANHPFTVSKLIAFCAFSRLPHSLTYASSIFSRVHFPNHFIFYVLIKGFCDNGDPLEAITLYAFMLTCLNELSGFSFSLPSVFKACGKVGAMREGLQVFSQVLKTHLLCDPFVSNSVVRMFLELGEIESARCVFDKMPERDLISWNSMLSGYMRMGKIELAGRLFEEMPEKDLVSCNVMIDGYGRSGRCELAEDVFKMASEKDVITWTSMISAYVNNHLPIKALDLFREMLRLGIKPDVPAVVSVLAAISDLGFSEEGKWVHAYISSNKINLSSGFIGSALIDMYSKCGYIENAFDIFARVSHERKIGDWNSMISGLAINGLGQQALEIFLDLERMDIKPDEITFLGLLTAFSHAGLVDEGQFYFKIMQEKYSIVPKVQHYGCLVDLYGRAGYLADALAVIRHMPIEADVLAWKSLLSSSVKFSNVFIGEIVALQAIELDPKDSSIYVLLSNIYAKAGRWDDVSKVRLLMKHRGVRKIPGCSTIAVNGKVQQFIVGQDMDLRYSSEIISKIEELVSRLKLEGYEPDLSQVFQDVEENNKESLLNLHSEKMALAFGLINTSKGAPIHIIKNLRICCDCHNFMKLVSKVYSHRIIVRDQNRFHQFDNGSCSCKDYW